MIHSLNTALMITGFVMLMMLVIEYINVITKGSWQNSLAKHKWSQYLLAVILGATPGCMGAFAVVAMFSHRVVSFGALVAAMIATSGDEAFVMFALFPQKALLLMAILAFIAILVGWLTDFTFTKLVKTKFKACNQLEIHEPEFCDCFPKDKIVMQWRQLTLARGVLSAALLLFALGIIFASIGPQAWDWKRITLLIAGLVGLFIVTTVPEHFLQEHLWKHVVLKHVPSIFLWTFGALLAANIITDNLNLEQFIQANTLFIILIACFLGIIPESGPHLIFVTLYAQGTVPMAVLLASSIVQDGHGMLPLLSYSFKDSVLIKVFNLIFGLIVGGALFALGL